MKKIKVNYKDGSPPQEFELDGINPIAVGEFENISLPIVYCAIDPGSGDDSEIIIKQKEKVKL